MKAIIFDFDGLIVDTETATFQAWQRLYRAEGVELSLQNWLQAVGHVDNFNPRQHLEELTGKSYHWPELDDGLRIEISSWINEKNVLPGIRELIQQAVARGLGIGVASNSDLKWVEDGLTKCGLRDSIGVLRTRDDVSRYKPHPDVYLSVLQALRVDPHEAIAFEDSEPGCTAAKAAGLFVVAVPNSLTRHHNLLAADELLDSLAGFTLPKSIVCQAAAVDKAE